MEAGFGLLEKGKRVRRLARRGADEDQFLLDCCTAGDVRAD